MADDNPYTAPQKHPSVSAPPKLMLWMLGVVFAAATGGGLIGTAIGAMLGAFVPGYYRSVFAEGSSANFDPLAVGIGQGLTQGAAGGTIVGLVVVGLYLWRLSETGKRIADNGEP